MPPEPAQFTLLTALSLMMIQSPQDLRHQAYWDGAAGESRSHLLSTLSSQSIVRVTSEQARLTIHRIDITFRHDTRTQISRPA